jgi:HK97 family phage major capsid protein
MADILNAGTLFNSETAKDIFNKVAGHSALAKLSAQTPIPFSGTDVFTFTLDKEAAIVAESGKKGVGGADLAPVKIVPVKIEYGARVSDEFMNATEEKQLDILTSYTDGCSKKFARALDIMAIHGFDPRTATASDLVTAKCFDTLVTNKVDYAAATADDNVDDAVALMSEGAEVNGLVMSHPFKTALRKMKSTAGVRLYPEISIADGTVTNFSGIPADVNSTVTFGSSKDRALVGDFQNAFKWGYAKDMNFEIIQFGDPDNSGKDLKGYNQVYLRCEAYVGFGILDPNAFAHIREAA